MKSDVEKTCSDCGDGFIVPCRRQLRVTCDMCRRKRLLANHYRFLATKNGKQAKSHDDSLYTKRHPEIRAAARRRYLLSTKGKVYLARQSARRSAQPFFSEFVTFKLEAFRDQSSCVLCGKPWVDGPRGVGHEVDHIMALRFGGHHHKSNLRVLCVDCHKAKTNEDHWLARILTKDPLRQMQTCNVPAKPVWAAMANAREYMTTPSGNG